MSKQKIMYIIAIVLLAGVSSHSVFAEPLLDTSTVLSTEVEGAVRNDTLVDTSVSAQQNTEIKNESVLTQEGLSQKDEKISPVSKTGNSLTNSVNALISGTIGAGVYSESEDFCKALDSTLMKQSDSMRASLAWNASSYEKNINLKYQGEAGSQESLHESSVSTYKDVSATLKQISPKSDASIDAVMLSRYQAIARSSLVELNMVFKAKTFDSARADEISKLLQGSLKCVGMYASQEDSNTENLTKTKTSLGEFVTSWNASKDAFGVKEDTEKEAFSLEVSSKEKIAEDEKVPESAENVVTKEDLASYTRAIIQSDTSVKNVSMDDTSVTLKYATRGKLFGFIPVWLSPKVVVSSTGEVSVKYPWHSSISSKKMKISEDSVKEKLVAAGIISSEAPESPVEMSMPYRAKLLESLDVIIKSELEVKATEEVDTEESVDAEMKDEAKVEGEIKKEDVVDSAPQA